jgi:hypothetical protein
MKKTVSGLIVMFIILGTISLPTNASSQSTGSHPTLTFSWTESGESYYGGVVSMSDEIKLDRVRISIYDTNRELTETGLFSEYAENRSYGERLEFTDANQNGKLDPGDIFKLTGVGIIDDWGIVITYEPTGKTLYSKTIFNEPFFLEEDEKDYDNTLLQILVITFIVVSLLLVLVYIYTRKN